ncbi:MAG: flagellar basal body P-ring biosynthesis protein, partial [Actinobacteria bacterium]|nr:flagellar basal body P-ring biosynthesis protein [Actinomycetota bacterium]
AMLTAGLISKEANRTVQVWAANSNLSPGTYITEQDVRKTSVLLPEASKNYISIKAQIIGATVLTKISAGDLIPVSSVSAADNAINQRFVPIAVAQTDLPLNLTRGDVIDLYAVPTRDSKFFTETQVIAEQVSVSEVFKESNLGQVSITVLLRNEQVLPLLQIISDAKVVIVKSI